MRLPAKAGAPNFRDCHFFLSICCRRGLVLAGLVTDHAANRRATHSTQGAAAG
jgi:hypothetical protein